MATPVRADINYNLLYNWSLQPPNVQNNLVRKNTNIQVVDNLAWEDPNLVTTYAYTTKHNIPYVSNIDMYIKKGEEDSLTHEVGHCLSDYDHFFNWWIEQPCFDAIYQAERRNNIAMYYGFYSKEEYFATAYDMYINNPKFLQRTNPMTYNFITVVLSYTL